MKQQINDLIERLAGKEEVYNPVTGTNMRIGRPLPILIGDVLDKIHLRVASVQELELLRLWHRCGLTKSLQDLFFGEGVEWEEVPEWNERDRKTVPLMDVPKDPNIRALFSFLLEVFPNPEL